MGDLHWLSNGGSTKVYYFDNKQSRNEGDGYVLDIMISGIGPIRSITTATVTITTTTMDLETTTTV